MININNNDPTRIHKISLEKVINQYYISIIKIMAPPV